MKKVLICLFIILMSIFSINVFLADYSFAAVVPVEDDAGGSGGSTGGGDCTSLLSDDWCNGDGSTVIKLLKTVAQILTAGVVVLGTVGMIWCGFLILTARDNESQVAAARKRLIDIIIGIVLFVLGSLLINLIFPGGDSQGIF